MSVSLPIILRPSVGRKIMMSLAAILTGALATLLITLGLNTLGTKPGPSMVALLIGAGFGLATLVSLLGVFRTTLILDAEGLTLQLPFRRLSCRWSEVDGDFYTYSLLINSFYTASFVCWDLKAGSEALSLWRKIKRSGAGEASINAMYGGLNAEQLAALLNRVRDDQVGPAQPSQSPLRYQS